MQFQQNNYFLTVVLGDFTTKLNLLFKRDTTSNGGSKINAITYQFGLQELSYQFRLPKYEI